MYFAQYFQQPIVTEAGIRARVNELAAQCADLHIGLLWQKEDLVQRWMVHNPGAGSPQTSNCAQQGALAAAAVAGDQQAIP